MDLHLDGITKSISIEQLRHTPVKTFGFDLRPKSFNFTTIKNIAEIISQYPTENYRLIFENESGFNISELLKKVDFDNSDVSIEICGSVDFQELEKLGISYSWRFHEGARFSDIKKAKKLKSIVIPHKTLEFYFERGELYGFLDLFRDSYFKEMNFRLLLDWDSSVLMTAVDQLSIQDFAFELNNKVEISYQNPDHNLIANEINKFKMLMK